MTLKSMMNIRFIVTAVVVLSFCALQAIAKKDVETAWLKYQAEFPIKRADQTATGISKRKANFGKIHALILKNRQNLHATFEMDHNMFSMMDDDEKMLYKGLLLPINAESSEKLAITGFSSRLLPTSLDYRSDICMPAIKDQGQCGSCWAFAAITPLEFAQCKKVNRSVLLSEQQLVDCDTSNFGCNGGWYSSSWGYLRNGSAKQSHYTYTAKDDTCKFRTCMTGAKVSSFGFLQSNNPGSMKRALQLYGPISVAFTVTSSFYAYKSGIYNDPECDNKTVNHAVAVVGWGTQNGMDYWIVRNSWGSSWGISGYFLVQRGVNKCNIEDYPAVITSIV